MLGLVLGLGLESPAEDEHEREEVSDDAPLPLGVLLVRAIVIEEEGRTDAKHIGWQPKGRKEIVHERELASKVGLVVAAAEAVGSE